MGLLKTLFGGGRMKDPVRGSARVVSTSGYHGEAIYQSCTMQLVVQADGVAATAVEFSGLVHNQRWPSPGMTLPVTVDRADPQNVKVHWDETEKSGDRARESAEDLAAAMRGESGGAAPFGSSTVINLSGSDLSDLTDAQRAKLSALGIDPAALADAAGASPSGTGGHEDEPDDRLAQLERLGKLREQGVLTDSEFAEQKRRILGA